MANELGMMTVKLGLDASGLTGGIGQAASKLSSFASSAPGLLGPLGTVLAVAGTAALGLGVASVKAAGDFEQSMKKNVASAGLAQSSYQDFSNKVIALGPAVGVAPLELSKGLFQVLSAGVPASQAMDTLKYSAQDAAIGMTSTKVTASALTAMMFDFGVTSKQASDGLNTAVGSGKFTVEQYAMSIGKLGSTAALAHRGMAETNAALDVLSYAFPSAAQASTGLSSLYTIMDIKTDTLAKRSAKLGLSFDETKFKTLSLAGQVQYLDKMTGNNPGQLLAILGQKNALQAIQALSSGSAKYTDILKSQTDGQKGAGATAAAFAVTASGLNFKVEQGKAAFQSMLIVIGTALLPALSKLVGFGTGLITNFTQWETKTHGVETGLKAVGSGVSNVVSVGSGIISFFQKNQLAMDALKSIAIGLGIALVIFAITQIPVAIVALAGLAVATWAAVAPLLVAAAPFIAIGIVIGIVVFGIIQVVRNWGAITTWLSGVWTSFKNFFIGMIQGLWQGMTAPFTKMGALFVWLYDHNKYIRLMVDQIRTWLTGAWTFTVNIWNLITTTFTSQAKAAWASVVSMWGQIGAVFSGAWSKYISGPITSAGASALNVIKSWGSQAYQSGASFINMLASGISNGVGVIGNAVKGIASTIWKNLGFASPTKEGVLSTSDQWMPNMTKLLSTGIIQGKPQITQAVQQIAAPITQLHSGATIAHNQATSHANSSSGSSHSSGHTAKVLQFHAPTTHHHLAPATHHHLAVGTHHHLASGTHHHKASGTHHHLAVGTHHHNAVGIHHHNAVGIHHHLAVGTHHHKASGTHHHLAVGIHHHKASGIHHHNAPGVHHHNGGSTHNIPGASTSYYSGVNKNEFTGKNENTFTNSSSKTPIALTIIVEYDGKEMARQQQIVTDRLVRLKLGPKGRVA